MRLPRPLRKRRKVYDLADKVYALYVVGKVFTPARKCKRGKR